MNYLQVTASFALLLMLSTSVAFAESSKNSSNDSSNTNLGCAYTLYGSLDYTSGSCTTQGTPTILSQAKGIPKESFDLLLDYDVKLYREAVFQRLQCGECWNYDILKRCQYDSDGDFTAGIPLRKFSDDQKAVLLDLNSTYSVTICPFKGKPTPVETPTVPNTIIRSDGSVNVMDLGKNTQSNITKSISNETSIQKNAQVSQKIWLSPLKQIQSGIPIQDIKCKEGFVLVIKESNDHPACVKPPTATRLLLHGWVTADKFESLQIDHNTKSSSFSNEITNHIVTEAKPANVTLCCTINASDLGNNENKPIPPQHTSIEALAPVNVSTNSSTMPGVIKILSIGMSPNPLKIGDIPMFTMTYQNISDKPVIVMGGCGSSLHYSITPASNLHSIFYPRPLCSMRGESINPNQTVTDLALVENNYETEYKIIKNGTLNVNMKLLWFPDSNAGQISNVNFTLNIPTNNETANSISQNNTTVLNDTNDTSNIANHSVDPFPSITEALSISPTIPNTVKIIGVGMYPSQPKAGDKLVFSLTFQNISDKPIYETTGCDTIKSLHYTVSPPSNVLELRGGGALCPVWSVEVEPNQIFTVPGQSSHLNGEYQIIKPGMLNVTLDLYGAVNPPPNDKTETLIDTIWFNVNATQ